MSNDQHNDTMYDRGQMRHDANRIFRDGEKALKNADIDKPVKLFGMFEVDAGLAAYATMAYNIVSDRVSGIAGKHTYDLTTKIVSPHVGLNTTLKTAALATTAMNVVLKTGGYIMPMFSDMRAQQEERVKTARRVATVLDEEVGSHSVRALRAAAKENSVLKAHLQRMGKINSVTNWNNFIDLGVNAAPNLALDYKRTQGMWAGEHPRDVDARLRATAVHNAANDSSAGTEVKEMGKLFMQGGTGAITDRIKKSNLHKLHKNMRPYDAFEMITTLDDQIQGNPKAKSFQVPGKKGASYPLEEYLARTVITHYEEMADLSNDYSVVREALHEELAQAVKPIAEAIRNGELSTMELIKLVGEEKIVQKGGRVIASPDEVRELIGQETHSSVNRPHESAKDHYARASYNPDEFKKALHAADGEDKVALAGLVSDEVLENAGMKKAEIKELHENNDYDREVAALTVGTAAQGDEALKAGGTAEKEVKAIDAASKKILHGGLAAVKTIKSTASNDNGIEHALLNAAVPRILEDKSYLGTVMSRGRDLLANDNETNDNEARDTERPRSHRERLQHARSGGHDFSAESFR